MKPLKILVYSLGITLVACGVYFLAKDQESVKQSEPAVTTPEGRPTFAWSYASFEKDEILRTTISLTARYANGFATTKVIDTIEGTCNEYENRDADVYSDSSMIICYYAGLGRYFKVVERENLYEVKRKEFEEASPDYNPPVRTFETIATF